MAEKDMVEFVEEWQRSAFLVLGPALGGGVSAVFVGSVLAFLAFSYLFYGRGASGGAVGRPVAIRATQSIRERTTTALRYRTARRAKRALAGRFWSSFLRGDCRSESDS